MIELVKLTDDYKRHLFEMMDIWTQIEEDIVPHAIQKYDYHDFDFYKDNIESKETEDIVPDTTLFGYNKVTDTFIGAVNIRHYLNEHLLNRSGHIGIGVLPAQRSKGYGTKLIALALEECRRLKINPVLMSCDKSNIASAKCIINNGGILENEVIVNNELIQRYWINLGDFNDNN